MEEPARKCPSEEVADILQDLAVLSEKSEKKKSALKKLLSEIAANKTEIPARHLLKASSEVSTSNFLALFLGVSQLKLPEPSKYKYKSDYESFKLYSTIIITVFTLINLFMTSKILDTLQILAQMYIYSTLTIREHILINNGSNIKMWWILHHYICIVITAIMLTCPDSSFVYIRVPVLKFLFVLSCSQVVQYQYQMRRLYILRSIERAHPLEITSEVMNLSMTANFGVAVSVLMVFQGVQVYVAYYIFSLQVSHRWENYQPAIGACLIFMMAVGNTSTILYTCCRKKFSMGSRKLSGKNS
ncbi:uncharacterized protein NEMAJ01_0730 [Nematocida major]|uniref:uncharacterized protein n=1 Tax=Nematocida major TaxID=1912982 RepID=UPI0020077DB2|nr:uncharacterized protein NEMAJ01_0730 [Nematocida major]KAH9385834.1 hypothetical protein NEMAJ01_0730 [Nematocida major]